MHVRRGQECTIFRARPRDIEDDGDFHYAVLGPNAVSESGKPSAEAKRFINETTAADRPRANRNAVVLAVPSRDGLDVARNRVREYLGWVEVQTQLKDAEIDPIRQQMLVSETDTARKRIPDAVKQAYSIVVTVNESNEIHAFKVMVTDEPLFTTIKADKRSRIQETAISAEAMLPGGPYDCGAKANGPVASGIWSAPSPNPRNCPKCCAPKGLWTLWRAAYSRASGWRDTRVRTRR